MTIFSQTGITSGTGDSGSGDTATTDVVESGPASDTWDEEIEDATEFTITNQEANVDQGGRTPSEEAADDLAALEAAENRRIALGLIGLGVVLKLLSDGGGGA